MKAALSIAIYTFREAVRNKILYSLLFFAIALIVLTLALGSASLQQDERVIQDVGLAAINLFSTLIAVFIGVTMVYQELERKTIFNVLSKPVPRAVYFGGKALGMMLVVLVQLVVMAVALCAVLLARGDGVSGTMVAAIALTYFEAMIVLGFALFFSSFSTPYVSGFLTGGLWLVGRLLQDLQAYIPKIDALAARKLTEAIVFLCPDLSLFTLTTQLRLGISVTPTYLASTITYGLCYAVTFFVAGALLFERRDFI